MTPRQRKQKRQLHVRKLRPRAGLMRYFQLNQKELRRLGMSRRDRLMWVITSLYGDKEDPEGL